MGGTMASEVGSDSARLEMLRARDPVMRARVEGTVRAELERARSLLEGNQTVLLRLQDELVATKRLLRPVVDLAMLDAIGRDLTASTA